MSSPENPPQEVKPLSDCDANRTSSATWLPSGLSSDGSDRPISRAISGACPPALCLSSSRSSLRRRLALMPSSSNTSAIVRISPPTAPCSDSVSCRKVGDPATPALSEPRPSWPASSSPSAPISTAPIAVFCPYCVNSSPSTGASPRQRPSVLGLCDLASDRPRPLLLPRSVAVAGIACSPENSCVRRPPPRIRIGRRPNCAQTGHGRDASATQSLPMSGGGTLHNSSSTATDPRAFFICSPMLGFTSGVHPPPMSTGLPSPFRVRGRKIPTAIPAMLSASAPRTTTVLKQRET